MSMRIRSRGGRAHTATSLTCGHGRCTELRTRIQQITDGEYAAAKRDVDALRAELGQPPLPGLQATLEEKSQQYGHFLF